jgi:hypothetical protein
MALFAISDLHLSLGTDKPMDVFSYAWEGYVEKLKKNWINTVKETDEVVIPGDISWATYLEDVRNDFDFLESLPGKKIISKGNHDYWWATIAKMENFLDANGYKSISFLHNNFYKYKEWAICGTRGWSSCEKNIKADHDKVFHREQDRLELSLQKAVNDGAQKIIAVMHYPPFYCEPGENSFINIMKRYNVSMCIYGHLHGDFSFARQGMIDGIEFKFVSSDYLEFMPLEICK